MPQLHEIMNQKSIDKLKESAQESLITIEAVKTDKPKATGRFNLPYRKDVEVSEPLLRYIHAQMWESGVPNASLPPGYSRATHKTVTGLVAKLGDESGVKWTKDQQRSLALQITRLLRVNRLIYNMANGNRFPHWAVAPWHEITWAVNPATQKTDWKVEKRIEEESTKNAEVTKRFDIATLGAPEPTPDGMVAWAEKVVHLFDRLNTQYEATLADLKSIRAERDELTDAMKKLQTDDWEVARNRIANLITKPAEGG